MLESGTGSDLFAIVDEEFNNRSQDTGITPHLDSGYVSRNFGLGIKKSEVFKQKIKLMCSTDS